MKENKEKVAPVRTFLILYKVRHCFYLGSYLILGTITWLPEEFDFSAPFGDEV